MTDTLDKKKTRGQQFIEDLAKPENSNKEAVFELLADALKHARQRESTITSMDAIANLEIQKARYNAAAGADLPPEAYVYLAYDAYKKLGLGNTIAEFKKDFTATMKAKQAEKTNTEALKQKIIKEYIERNRNPLDPSNRY